MGRTSHTSALIPGSALSVGGKEVEVDSVLPKDVYLAGRQFLNVKPTPDVKTEPDYQTPLLPKAKLPTAARVKAKASQSLVQEEAKEQPHVTAPRSLPSQTAFKTPLLNSTVLPQKHAEKPTPRHDPLAPNAIVMKRPNSVRKGKQIVDVVVDPILTKTLREHQREAIKFMYEGVMGMRDYDGQGVILADEMGAFIETALRKRNILLC